MKQHSIPFILLFLCTFVNFSRSRELYLPQNDPSPFDRQQAIEETSTLIRNEPRFITIDDTAYPLNAGPIPYNGSLAQQLVLQELALILSNSNPNLSSIVQSDFAANIQSLEDYQELYQNLSTYIDIPISTINPTDDIVFGSDRLAIRGHHLSRVRGNGPCDLDLTPDQIKSICGATLQDLLQQKRLYLNDFSFVSKFNDPNAPHKYVPDTTGYFCVNSKSQLVPLAILVHNTNLLYSPFDAPDEWQLAKMALSVGDHHMQQWDHFVQTHLILEPIYVELMRSMSSNHPVYALVEFHLLQIFGNTEAGETTLLSKNSQYDLSFAWGATGTLRFLKEAIAETSFDDDFEARMKRNALNDLPHYKYRDDARALLKALKRFLNQYLTAYYCNKQDVVEDKELQAWAQAVQNTTKGFPDKFKRVDDIVDVLSNIIFRVSVQHHAMNGAVTWHMDSYPYNVRSLWHPMPTSKGTEVDLLLYVPKRTVHGLSISLVAGFYREIPSTISLQEAYNFADLGTRATQAIEGYVNAMNRIERKIEDREYGNPRPYNFLKPSQLPYYVWI